MHHPRDRIAHTTAFVTYAESHRLEHARFEHCHTRTKSKVSIVFTRPQVAEMPAFQSKDVASRCSCEDDILIGNVNEVNFNNKIIQ